MSTKHHPSHLIIKIVLCFGKHSHGTQTPYFFCPVREVYPYTAPPNFFVTNFPSDPFQVPGHPAKSFANTHESVRICTPDHYSFQIK